MTTRNRIVVAVLIIIICLMGLVMVNQSKKLESQRVMIEALSAEQPTIQQSPAPVVAPTPTKASSTPSVVVPSSSGTAPSVVTPAPKASGVYTNPNGSKYYVDANGKSHAMLPSGLYQNDNGSWVAVPGTPEPGQDHTPGVHGNFYTDEQGNIYPLMTPNCYRSSYGGQWLNIAPPHNPCMID